MMRVDNFILNARAAMKSLLTWMETICQKLKTGSQPETFEAGLLVCSCIRDFFKELRNVRASIQIASNMAFITDRSGSYLWAMVQQPRITQKIFSHRWLERPAIAEATNCHLFRFLLPYSIYRKLNDEVERERQCNLSQFVTRIFKLEKNQDPLFLPFFLLVV